MTALKRCKEPYADSAAEDGDSSAVDTFPRIRRTKKDKDRFPDRINLDKKGLTAIPVIEDEPHLRLLSLQHNLINVFCVPGGAEEDIPESRTEAQGCVQPVRHLEAPNLTTSRRPVLMNRNRKNCLYCPLSPTTSTSSSTPSILINGVPSARFVSNGKSLQSLNINPKLICKKGVYIPFHLQPTLLANHFWLGKRSDEASTACDASARDRSELPVSRSIYGETLKNLVFLDLYDNQIERIENLDGLRSLTVLLLGKNRIVDISGITSVRNSLRVLDLHGNRISNIGKISRLHELKSLNLAGNTLRQIHNGDFVGLNSLRELNLKRNRIKCLSGFDDLQNLERLWLCNNDLHRIEDLGCIAKAINLKEITVENNPVALAGDCCSFLVSFLPNLLMLSQMHVTDQVRRAANAWRRSKESSDSAIEDVSSEVVQSYRREEVISNARTNWELLRSQPKLLKTREKIADQPPILPADNALEKTTPRKDSPPQDVVDTKLTPKEVTAQDQESLKLPPISECSVQVENLVPAVQKIVSVEDSLGGNVDSTSIFSVSSSNTSSRSPSASRSSGRTSVTSDLEELDGTSKSEANCKAKDEGTGEEDEGIRVGFPRQLKPIELKSEATPNSEIAENQKMPAIRIAENDAVVSTITADTSGNACALDESLPSGASLRPFRNRSGAFKRPVQLLPPTTAGRTMVAKPSPSVTNASLVLSNNSSLNGKGSPGFNAATAAVVSATSSTQAVAGAKNHGIDREREQGGDYLIEICGRYLNVYGTGALKFVDKQWNVQKAGDVHTVKFSYVPFNQISGILGKVKSRFPNAEHLYFRETNISSLGQLNSLAEIQGLQSITIEAEGNLVCSKKWRGYAIFRLYHWGLKQINGQEITETEVQEADRLFGNLPDLVLWSLPESLLAPLLSKLRLEEPLQASRLNAKEWLMQAEPSLKCVVGKEALQWKRWHPGPQQQPQGPYDESIRMKGQQCFSKMMETTCNAVEKLHHLKVLWPNMLSEMVRNTLIDYSQFETYGKTIHQQ